MMCRPRKVLNRGRKFIVWMGADDLADEHQAVFSAQGILSKSSTP